MRWVDEDWWGVRGVAAVSDLLRVDIVPGMGGRIMNFEMGAHRFLWSNPGLYGVMPPVGGLGADGGWMNWGGDKVWLAPQGWEGEGQWAGPPDGVLDGGAYVLEVLQDEGEAARVRLTSPVDARSGVQLSREVAVEEGCSRLRIVASMMNTGDRVRRWGLWPVTQMDAASRCGTGWNAKLTACVPLREGGEGAGYRVMYGSERNPQFVVEEGVVEVRYGHQVGKIGVDADAGWVAVVDGESGYVLVQQMMYEDGAEYPDGASVEVWTNGLGTLTAYGRTEEMPEDLERNPYMMECELVSRFAELKPGERYDFAYAWAATNIGADGVERRRIRSCSEVGCEVEAFGISSEGQLRGRFGVFYSGQAVVEFLDAAGQRLGLVRVVGSVSPLEPLVLLGVVEVPRDAQGAVLALYRGSRRVGELGRVSF